jgi:Zn finger protein HypA/HybF involved in hydrogenase expression
MAGAEVVVEIRVGIGHKSCRADKMLSFPLRAMCNDTTIMIMEWNIGVSIS